MEIKTKGDKIVAVKIGGIMTIPLRDVKSKDLTILEGHVTYIEEHILSADDGFPWTKEEIKSFLDDSSEKQRNMLKKLLNYPKGIQTKDLVNQLGLSASQAIAGLMAGFTKRVKRDFGNKQSLVDQNWSNKLWTNTYWIREEYFKIIKTYFSQKK